MFLRNLHRYISISMSLCNSHMFMCIYVLSNSTMCIFTYVIKLLTYVQRPIIKFFTNVQRSISVLLKLCTSVYITSSMKHFLLEARWHITILAPVVETKGYISMGTQQTTPLLIFNHFLVFSGTVYDKGVAKGMHRGVTILHPCHYKLQDKRLHQNHDVPVDYLLEALQAYLYCIQYTQVFTSWVAFEALLYTCLSSSCILLKYNM